MMRYGIGCRSRKDKEIAQVMNQDIAGVRRLTNSLVKRLKNVTRKAS